MPQSKFSPAELKRRNERMWGPPGYQREFVPPLAATPSVVISTSDNGLSAASIQSGDY